jgi:hypothetical protein
MAETKNESDLPVGLFPKEALRPDLQKAVANFADSNRLSESDAINQIVERGLSAFADDRGEG